MIVQHRRDSETTSARDEAQGLRTKLASPSKSPEQLRPSVVKAFVVVAVFASVLLLVPANQGVADASSSKTMSGQVHCSGFQKVESIWFLGSSSGWHGKNVPSSERVSSMVYSFTAQKGETIQVWLKCSFAREKYSSFKVGRGSTRHVCGWSGFQVCTSERLGGCVLRQVLTTRISLVGCLRHL